MKANSLQQSELVAERYQVLSLLGRGGFAEVYLAEDTKLSNRLIALKVMSSHVFENPDRVRKFRQEAAIIAHLTHPNTVRCFDFGSDEKGRYFIAMEYVQGETLHSLLKKQKNFSLGRALQIAIQTLDALEEAHQMGIIHRDLKPKNIILRPHRDEEQVKVLDFGVARVVDPGQDISENAEWTLVGTATYMSPEQAKSLPLSPASDIYSVGCILYQMISGKPPFTTQFDPIALMLHHANTPVESLLDLSLPFSIPFELDQAVLKSLEKDPKNRFRQAGIFRQTLEKIYETIEKKFLLDNTNEVGKQDLYYWAHSEEKPQEPSIPDPTIHLTSGSFDSLKEPTFHSLGESKEGSLRNDFDDLDLLKESTIQSKRRKQGVVEEAYSGEDSTIHLTERNLDDLLEEEILLSKKTKPSSKISLNPSNPSNPSNRVSSFSEEMNWAEDPLEKSQEWNQTYSIQPEDISSFDSTLNQLPPEYTSKEIEWLPSDDLLPEVSEEMNVASEQSFLPHETTKPHRMSSPEELLDFSKTTEDSYRNPQRIHEDEEDKTDIQSERILVSNAPTDPRTPRPFLSSLARRNPTKPPEVFQTTEKNPVVRESSPFGEPSSPETKQEPVVVRSSISPISSSKIEKTPKEKFFPWILFFLSLSAFLFLIMMVLHFFKK